MNANTKKIYVNYNEELNGFEIKYGFVLSEEQQKANRTMLGLGWNKIGKYYYARLTAKNEQFYLDYVNYLKKKGYQILPLVKAATK